MFTGKYSGVASAIHAQRAVVCPIRPPRPPNGDKTIWLYLVTRNPEDPAAAKEFSFMDWSAAAAAAAAAACNKNEPHIASLLEAHQLCSDLVPYEAGSSTHEIKAPATLLPGQPCILLSDSIRLEQFVIKEF